MRLHVSDLRESYAKIVDNVTRTTGEAFSSHIAIHLVYLAPPNKIVDIFGFPDPACRT